MSDDNKRNLQYFEAPSMRELFDAMDAWQREHRKRLQSLNVHPDAGVFCCIAVTNPTEVVIMDGGRHGGVGMSTGLRGGNPPALRVSTVDY